MRQRAAVQDLRSVLELPRGLRLLQGRRAVASLGRLRPLPEGLQCLARAEPGPERPLTGHDAEGVREDPAVADVRPVLAVPGGVRLREGGRAVANHVRLRPLPEGVQRMARAQPEPRAVAEADRQAVSSLTMAQTTLSDRGWTWDGTPLSYDDFLRVVPEGSFLEWVDGEVVEMSPVSRQHTVIARFLIALFQHFVEHRGKGVVLFAPFQMRLARSGREPDVMYIAEEHQDRLRRNHLI